MPVPKMMILAAGVLVVVLAAVFVAVGRDGRQAGAAAPPPVADQQPVVPAPPAMVPPALPPHGSAAAAGAPDTRGAPAPSAPKLPAPVPEAQLMARLRAIKDKDPAAAADLAREGNRRFPDSADAPERASILVHALATQGQPSAARGEAEAMVNRYPDSEWVREVERFSGAHRHRNIKVTDGGQLRYE